MRHAWGGYDGGFRRRGGGPYGGDRYDRGFREPFGPERYGESYREPFRSASYDEDEAIRRAVRWTLFEDTWLDARRIDIGVEDGIVTLTGEVNDHLSARYAWDDAWETPGVRGVISRLEVRDAPSRQ